ncbi:MAG: extracellular solute-binding protein [Pseudomonadota bacterium]|nr:extracellular solute-binding protein [Pseudomonadota bacterium]
MKPARRRLAGRAFGVLSLLAAGFGAGVATGAAAAPQQGIAMHGEPALAAGFPHFAYVNPAAPKGGRITYGMVGSFDSLNPFIVKGVAPRGLSDGSFGYNVFEPLMVRGRDEPFTLYGLIAETVETPEDRSWVEFRLRPEARFSDGHPITAEDVIFSMEVLRDKGRPNYRSYFAKIARAERVGARGVRFVFSERDREMPLILGLMPVLPKHRLDPETFDQTSFETPVGSGPYRVSQVEPGARLVLRRNPDYWGARLPVKQGFDNYDEIRIEHYRDSNTLFEAFKKGLVDVRFEDDPGRWTTGYDFPAAREGRVVLDTFRTGAPQGMLGLVMNTRRPVFADVRVREALLHLFDFEWANANLFFGAYARTKSYFEGSDLSSYGRPADEAERALLAPFRAAVREDMLEGTWRIPETDGSGYDRHNIRKAIVLLKAAGYEVQDGVMRKTATGEPLAFELLTTQREQERLALNYEATLKRVGIAVAIRQVDSAQFQRRRTSFDFDMTQFYWPVSLSPGNEQAFRWSSAAADAQGSFNLAGVKSPAADALIEALLAAREREQFASAVRALDRVLLSGFYVVPLYHLPGQWIARWSHIGRPERTSLYGAVLDAWWRKPEDAR